MNACTFRATQLHSIDFVYRMKAKIRTTQHSHLPEWLLDQ